MREVVPMRMLQRLSRSVALAMAAATVATLAPAIPSALAQEGAYANPIEHAEFSGWFGVYEPRGESDLWDFNKEFTTQDVSDFDNWTVGMGFGMPLGRHWDV